MEGTSALLSNYATPCHCQPACKQQEERINCLGLCPHYRPNYANILARSTGARTAVRGDCVKFSAWSSEVRMSGTDGGKKGWAELEGERESAEISCLDIKVG